MPPLRRSTEGAALVNTEVIPETGALTLQCSGTHLGADASDEVRALVEAVSSCSPAHSDSFSALG